MILTSIITKLHRNSLFAVGFLLGLTSLMHASSPSIQAVTQGDITAYFHMPTDRYGHGVLGDTPEWGSLCLAKGDDKVCIDLKSDVFEDLAPRLYDIDNDGDQEVVVVQSNQNLGAALVIYDLEDGELRKIATPNIGTRYRWLAPVGIGDFNGDGDIDIAYVDRPHLAKTLRVWTYRDGQLTEVANLAGLTNHRIGQAFISGGVRQCDGTATLITADAGWQNIMETRLVGTDLQSKVIGPFTGTQSLTDALGC